MNKRFLASWLTGSAIMIVLSYSWHGLALNDLMLIPFSRLLVLLLGFSAYLVIGLILAYSIFHLGIYRKSFGKRYSQAFLIGSGIGVAIFMVMLAVRIALGMEWNTLYAIMDLTWQMFEQGVGGAVATVAYTAIIRLQTNVVFQ